MFKNLSAQLIESAKLILESPNEIPHEALVGRIKDAHGSGRYHITSTPTDHGHSFTAIPKKSDNAVDYQHRVGRPEVHWHDPEISHLETPHPEDPYPRTYARLKPDSGYQQEIPNEKTDGVMYRGMSHEEFHSVKHTGKIQSLGGHNMDGQEGLTYFSHSPAQAQFYANSFAPVQHKATGQHPAYVVAVKNPGTGVRVPGTGEDEIGIPHHISDADILHVHVGRVFAAEPGSFDVRKEWDGKHVEGSSSAPSTSIGWKKEEYKK